MEGPRVASDGVLSREELAGRRVLVIGLGRSGLAVARVLARAGATVFASDARADLGGDPAVAELRDAGVEVETGGHRKASRWLREVDFVVPSPGISPRGGILSDAIAEGIPVLSEVEIASRFVRVPVVAVTGTNGKTSTCRMIGEALRADGRRTVVCGNIGHPFVAAAVEQPDAEVFVVEVSSFQLAFCYAFHPHVAVVTNVAPDHLDWHGSMEAYLVAKSRICARQGRQDWYVYPAAQPELDPLCPRPGPRRLPFSLAVLPAGDGAWLDGCDVYARVGSDVVVRVGSAQRLAGFGPPFVEDGLAAAAASLAMGAAPEAVASALATFTPDHHRLELVAEVEGVRYVDDSKATNPHATLAALRGMRSVVLIAGGLNKGLDFSGLRAEAGRLRGVIGLGQAGPDVVRVFEGTGVPARVVGTMAEAVAAARELARPGDTVLLSPACASQDLFGDYAERGRAFQQAVRQLASGGGSA